MREDQLYSRIKLYNIVKPKVRLISSAQRLHREIMLFTESFTMFPITKIKSIEITGSIIYLYKAFLFLINSNVL